MRKPKDVAGVQRFIGMVKYLAKFLPRLSEVCEPLRSLTHKDAPWVWGKDHDKSFADIQKAICEAPVLKYFDHKAATEGQADASSKGLGFVLMQEGRPSKKADSSNGYLAFDCLFLLCDRTLIPGVRAADFDSSVCLLHHCKFFLGMEEKRKCTLWHRQLQWQFQRPCSEDPMFSRRMDHCWRLEENRLYTVFTIPKNVTASLQQAAESAPQRLSEWQAQGEVTFLVHRAVLMLRKPVEKLSPFLCCAPSIGGRQD
eukprot:gene7265-12952_t